MINIKLMLPLLLSTVLFTGCYISNNSGGTLSIDDSLSYLENKYHDSFSFVEDSRSEVTSKHLKFFVTNSKYPNEHILVTSEITSSGVIFNDSYMSVKFNAQTSDYTKSLASGVFGDCKVVAGVQDSRTLPDYYDNSMTFEDYKKKKSSLIYVYIVLPPSHSDNDAERELDAFTKVCASNEFVCIGHIYYASDSDYYYNANSEADLVGHSGKVSKRCSFIIDDDFTVSAANVID